MVYSSSSQVLRRRNQKGLLLVISNLNVTSQRTLWATSWLDAIPCIFTAKPHDFSDVSPLRLWYWSEPIRDITRRSVLKKIYFFKSVPGSGTNMGCRMRDISIMRANGTALLEGDKARSADLGSRSSRLVQHQRQRRRRWGNSQRGSDS